MNYGFNDDQVEKPRINFPAGENVSDVTLIGCEYCSGPTWEGLDFNYVLETKDGTATLRDRMFCINEERVRPYANVPGDTKEDALKREYARFNTRLAHVASKFKISREELAQACNNCTTPKELITNYCDLLNGNVDDTKLYLKTVVDNKGWTRVAKFPTFLQRMDSGQGKLSYTKSERNQMNDSKSISGVQESEADEKDWGIDD